MAVYTSSLATLIEGLTDSATNFDKQDASNVPQSQARVNNVSPFSPLIILAYYLEHLLVVL